MEKEMLLGLLLFGLLIAGCAQQTQEALGLPGTNCTSSKDCQQNLVCVNNICRTPPACREQSQACSANSDCCNGLTCSNYKCISSGTQTPAPTTISEEESVQYWTNSDIGILLYSISSNPDESKLLLKNNKNFKIKLTSITFDGGSNVLDYANDVFINPNSTSILDWEQAAISGQVVLVNLTGVQCSSTGERYSKEVVIQYTDVYGTTYTLTGEKPLVGICGKVSGTPSVLAKVTYSNTQVSISERDSAAYWAGADVGITRYYLSSDATTSQLVLRNNKVFQLSVTSVSFDGVSVFSTPTLLNPGSSTAVNLTTAACSTSGQNVSHNVVITYIDPTYGTTHTFTGEKPLVGTCQGGACTGSESINRDISEQESEGYWSGANIAITRYYISSKADSSQLVVRNNQLFSINLTSISFDCGPNILNNTSRFILAPGSSAVVGLTGVPCSNTGTTYSKYVAVQYTDVQYGAAYTFYGEKALVGTCG